MNSKFTNVPIGCDLYEALKIFDGLFILYYSNNQENDQTRSELYRTALKWSIV